MFSFGQMRPRRRPSLTPMIDVVFLLLVFFMLASRFGHDEVLELALGGGSGGAWVGPPRLVDIAHGGARLNGIATTPEALAPALTALMQSPADPVVVRAREGAVQDLATVLDALRAAGLTNLILLE